MKKQDIRIIRTLQLIRSAFLALLEEKGFGAITVQDILDHAQINRSTFYKHFKNKDEVALKMVDEIKELFHHNFKHRFSMPTKTFIQMVAPLFNQYHHLIRIVGGIRTSEIHLYDDLHQLIKIQYVDQAALIRQKKPEELDFQGHLFSTVTIGIMRYFIEKGEMPSSDDVLSDVKDVFGLLVINSAGS